MDLQALLGGDAEDLFGHTCSGIRAENLTLPGPDFVDRVFVDSDRPPAVLRNLQLVFATGRLANTGYLSILPVDQGIEHSGAASFSKEPEYFDPKSLCELALDGGCNAIATTVGALAIVSRRFAHKIPFIVKLNHNEFLTLPERVRPDHVRLGRGSV